MSLQILENKNLKISTFCEPWTYWQIDDFMPKPEFKQFQRRLCAVDKNFQKRENDIADLNFMFLPDLKLAKYFLHARFKNFLEKTTGTKLSIYEKGLVQLRKMDGSSPAFPIHIDAQDERSLVCLYYLSPQWTPKYGGELCLHQDEESKPAKKIAPIENRMVLFFSDDRHWHSINKVYNWSRYTIVSEWIVQKESK